MLGIMMRTVNFFIKGVTPRDYNLLSVSTFGQHDVSKRNNPTDPIKICSKCGRLTKFYKVSDGERKWVEYYCVNCNSAVIA